MEPLCRAREEAKIEPYSEIYEEEPTPFDEMYKEASVFGSEVSWTSDVLWFQKPTY